MQNYIGRCLLKIREHSFEGCEIVMNIGNDCDPHQRVIPRFQIKLCPFFKALGGWSAIRKRSEIKRLLCVVSKLNRPQKLESSPDRRLW